MFQTGYKVNEYLAVEGHYTLGFGDSEFTDYISLYDDTGFDYRAQLDDVDADAWTVGFSYNF